MDPFPLRPAIQTFLAFVLLSLAIVTLWSTRRPKGWALSAFLVLVAANHGLAAVRTLGLGPPDLLRTLEATSLALDPFFLVLVVLTYTDTDLGRRRRWIVVYGAAACLLAAVVAVQGATLVRWETTNRSLGSLPVLQGLLIGHMFLAYALALAVAGRRSSLASTPKLALRSDWLLAAVGVAVVPRFVQWPVDLGLDRLVCGVSQEGCASGASPATQVALLALGGLSALAVFFAAMGMLQRPHVSPGSLQRSRMTVLLVTLAVAGGAILLVLLGDLVPNLYGLSVLFGLRWIAFGAIAVQGLLAFEVAGYSRWMVRGHEMLVAAWTAGAAALLALALAARWGHAPGTVWGLGLAVGIIGWAAGKPLGRRLGRGSRLRLLAGRAGHDAPFWTYRSLLEDRWPRRSDARVQQALARERRRLGLTADEAETIGHLVGTTMASSRPVRPGEEILPGVIVGQLMGGGAQGDVFAAVHAPTGRPLAVKVLAAAGTATERTRVREELASLRRVRHRAVPALRDVTWRGAHAVLVMERAPGRQLLDVCREGPVASATLRSVYQDIASALDAVHEAGIVHGDISAANILVSDEGAMLVDFGLGRSGDAEGTWLGQGTAGAATPAYAAPETLAGGPTTAAADRFAFARVLARAATGSIDPADRDARACLEDALGPQAATWILACLDPDPLARPRGPAPSPLEDEVAPAHRQHVSRREAVPPRGDGT